MSHPHVEACRISVRLVFLNLPVQLGWWTKLLVFNPDHNNIAVVMKLLQYYDKSYSSIYERRIYERAIIATWLNTSQRSRDGVGMNRSARG